MRNFTLINFRKLFFAGFCLAAFQQAAAQADWVPVPTPDASATRNMLRGISGTSSSDIWTVGSFEQVFTVPPYYKQNDLIMHWNGSAWFTYPPMNLSFTLDDLWDVQALSPTNVWAVGLFNGASDPQGEILHFDGAQWTAHNPPAITGGSGFFTMDATSANDIWAAGYQTGSPTRPAYVMHYNGNTWNEVAVPPVGLYWNLFRSIDAVSPTSVWAAGYRGEFSGDLHALVMRWNGTAWQTIALPSTITTPLSEVMSIKALSDDDVWIVGYFLTGGGFKLHWNGSTWTEMPDPNGGGGAFAAIAQDNVFSVGSAIWHWDGSSWTLSDALAEFPYPSLVNAVTFPNGDIWACGVATNVDDNTFHTLVYRTTGALSTSIPEAQADIKLFPNPAHDFLMVSAQNSTTLKVTVTDVLGKVMQVTSAQANSLNIDVSGYANGVYLTRIEGPGFVEIRKFAVKR